MTGEIVQFCLFLSVYLGKTVFDGFIEEGEKIFQEHFKSAKSQSGEVATFKITKILGKIKVSYNPF